MVREDGLTLATAPVVVGGGRGCGSAEGFASLERLAALLGGVVGCSRVATNNGWRPHSDQVGQTGTRIAPKLYLNVALEAGDWGRDRRTARSPKGIGRRTQGGVLRRRPTAAQCVERGPNRPPEMQR